MIRKPKKKLAKKSVKSKIKSRRLNPINPSEFDLEEFLDKKVVLRVSYGVHNSGGSIYGLLKKLPHQDDMYFVSTKENTPHNKEGGFLWFNIKDISFAGYLFGGMPEILVGELKKIK